jgi:glycosyltransferase involved in cell wall biosynthesis
MDIFPAASVIIPTYNRKANVLQTLLSLKQQSWPSECFEVIVVDDGSTDDTNEVAAMEFPFALRYVRQTNQGDAAARNLGAQESRADILVFLDDDMIVERDYLICLLEAQKLAHKRIVVGTEYLCLGEGNNKPPQKINNPSTENRPSVEIAFTEVVSNNMCIRRDAFFTIGMMESLDFPGSSIWCDVDFSYRAYRKGFEFIRSTKAICWHKDYTRENLDNYKNRMRTASFRAVSLFQKFPELISYLPMFSDKTPISWNQDPPGLIGRKVARRLISTNFTLWVLERCVNAIDKFYPSSDLTYSFSRWIVGGYIFRGYREGLRANGFNHGYGKKENTLV